MTHGMSSAGHTFTAPGRVNLIGEHTDYTGGFVLPMAIDFATTASVDARQPGHASRSSRRKLRRAGRRYRPERFPFAWPRPLERLSGRGCMGSSRQAGIDVPAFTLRLDGNVPLGSGLSSSASVEVATAMALLQSGERRPFRGPRSLRSAAAPRTSSSAGRCGIMDQFVIVYGRAGHALLLDCRSLEHENLPLPPSVSVVICNSMVKHTVAHGEYGDRNGEVMAGQAVLVARTAGRRLAAGRDARRSRGLPRLR